MVKVSAAYKTARTSPEDVTDPIIPISWFTRHSYMSPGQALSLYLINELEFTFTDAATLLKKEETTVRRSFHIAEEKVRAKKEEEARLKRKRRTPAEIK